MEKSKPSDNQDVSQGAAKFDADKVRMDLIPPEFAFATAGAFTYGAIKYDDWNWAKGIRKGRVLAALLRHTFAALAGEKHDKESSLPHSWHMAACVAMLIGAEQRDSGIDDIHPAEDAWASAHSIFGNMNHPPLSTEEPLS